MVKPTTQLIKPEAKYLQSYLASLVEDKGIAHEATFKAKLADYHNDLDAYYAATCKGGDPIKLEDGHTYLRVPETVYWLVDGEAGYLGSIRVRTQLNAFLREFGGHIGYDIRSSERKKGYGTLMLKLVKPYLKQLGLTRVLITCDEDNLASRKVIEHGGAELQDVVKLPFRSKLTRRYWLEVK